MTPRDLPVLEQPCIISLQRLAWHVKRRDCLRRHINDAGFRHGKLAMDTGRDGLMLPLNSSWFLLEAFETDWHCQRVADSFELTRDCRLVRTECALEDRVELLRLETDGTAGPSNRVNSLDAGI